MSDLSDEAKDNVSDHLRIALKALALIEQLSRAANSCDHKLVHSYVINAISRVQAAHRELTERDDSSM